MLLKPNDDKDARVAELERLAAIAPPDRKAKIDQELRAVRAGLKGEQEAAYLIDFDLRDSKYTAVIHDLRLEVGGRVAQIDHLILHRTLNVFVIETKHLHAGIKITEEGEFLRWNDFKKTYEGMASPFAQNERHIAVLKDAFDQIEMPTRMGVRLSPVFVSYVLVSPNARIDRPKRFDTSGIIKADMLLDSIRKRFDKEGTLNTLGGMTRFVSSQTVEGIGRRLIALHKPASFDVASRYRLPERATSGAVGPRREPARQGRTAADQRWSEGADSKLKCRGCGSEDLLIQYGKYGYYFKCRACNANTPIKVSCGRDGHKERIRKDGPNFYRECADCKTSYRFFVNS